MNQSTSSLKEVRNLLIILFSAILFACGLVFFMVHNYIPSETYLAKNVLLSPESLHSMQLENRKGKKTPELKFEHIRFTYFDKEKWSVSVVPLEKYERFYERVSPLQSLSYGIDFGSNPAMLSLSFKQSQELQSFIEIQFSPQGKYFRVSLLGSNQGQQWVYFESPGITPYVLTLFEASP